MRSLSLTILLAVTTLAQTPKEALSQQLYRQIAGPGPTLGDIHHEIQLVRADQLVILRRGNANTLRLLALEKRVESLDVTLNSDRLTIVEGYIRDDKEAKRQAAAEAKADRLAMMAWIRPSIMAVLGTMLTLLGSIIVSSWKTHRRLIKRNRELDEKLQGLGDKTDAVGVKADAAYEAANHVDEKIDVKIAKAGILEHRR